MITVRGEEWGTAAELAARLGTTVATIRNWSNRPEDGLRKARMRGEDGRPAVHYPLRQAAVIERDKRRSGRGRPRQVA